MAGNKKPADERKTYHVNAYMNDEERDMLLKMAEFYGMSYSDILRCGLWLEWEKYLRNKEHDFLR